ncbi:MAG: DUF881 domain-containing protein [Dermatophilaceae bacterium]|nr:DUF881 domain-containing protein [Dermatophilaceae bacterium]NUR15412.1 DUF881 domain-containing protein [Dermatophilaceae bacterium]
MTPSRRPDASMTLLTTMMERPLDAGYQEAADRRVAAGLPRATSTRTVLVVVLAILTGFLFAVAAQSLRPKPTAAAAVKSELVTRIEAQQEHGVQQEAGVAALGKQVRDYEALALQQSGGGDLTTTIKSLEVQAAAVPLKGPGLTLTLDDAASTVADANAGNRPSSGFEAGRVTSADLQIVVNGLWGAGAEAISINGHRLSSTAAIRFAGQAIIVDFRPLARPYVITALGDSQAMQQLFEPSFAGVYLSQLTEEFKIRSVLAGSDNLTVPGDSAARLEVAEPIRPPVGSSAPSVPGLQQGTSGPQRSPVPSTTGTTPPPTSQERPS